MITIVGEIFNLIFIAVIIIICVHYESKLNSLKSHNTWKFEVSKTLHQIENNFSGECKKIIEESLSKYTEEINVKEKLKDYEYESLYLMINQNGKRISFLAVDYKKNVTEKAINIMGKHRLTVIPEELQRSYETEINDIADVYKDFLSQIESELIKIRYPEKTDSDQEGTEVLNSELRRAGETSICPQRTN